MKGLLHGVRALGYLEEERSDVRKLKSRQEPPVHEYMGTSATSVM